MTFSICIPNYNYARYIGATIQSVLAQEGADFEICVSDNASSDGSLEVVRGFNDPRIRVSVNAVNLGFARNLDCAVAMATGDTVIVLSSDDLMAPGALRRYREILEAMGPEKAARAVIGSDVDVIDASGARKGGIAADPLLWTAPATGGVRRETGAELLGRCLRTMRNPYSFCSVAWPRALGAEAGGFGGNRSINPDKWLNWQLLALPGVSAHHIGEPLFRYRVHASNQNAGQKRSGALFYLVDEYLSTVQLSDSHLVAAGATRADVERAFVEWDIAKHGLGALGREGWMKAFRTMYFGFACYPWRCLSSRWWWLLALTLATGPLGWFAARTRAARADSVPS